MSLARQDAEEVETLALLQAEVLELRDAIRLEDDALEKLNEESADATAQLESIRRERQDIERRLLQHQRREERQVTSTKLVKLQLAVATQLHGVAEHLTQIPAQCSQQDRSLPEALVEREREIEELKRALRRQQQLVADAHRQLLELATKRHPMGAASAHAEMHAMRTALGEQELARMRAEARADELQAQVRLLEEQGLRLRLHRPPPITEDAQQRPVRVLLPTSMSPGS
ncbi:hypothetical protein AB1Y20_019178 [Prymnesium parvum]|uniref:Cilia- and flagella-associated protein 157 n=1 Tax=Prymnesium parvum TaxID=97485 RepID=A0AB34JUA1_PRYPA